MKIGCSCANEKFELDDRCVNAPESLSIEIFEAAIETGLEEALSTATKLGLGADSLEVAFDAGMQMAIAVVYDLASDEAFEKAVQLVSCELGYKSVDEFATAQRRLRGGHLE